MTTVLASLHDFCDNSSLLITAREETSKDYIFSLSERPELRKTEYYLTQLNVDFAHAPSTLTDEETKFHEFRIHLKLSNGDNGGGKY